jgi:subtilisin family serine protease
VALALYILCACRARDNKVKNNYASAVISMSIAGPRSAALNDAVEAAVAAGITVVTAAGEPY